MTNKKYVAAIDQGTTSTRCIIFDHNGEQAAVGHRHHARAYGADHQRRGERRHEREDAERAEQTPGEPHRDKPTGREVRTRSGSCPRLRSFAR